MDVNKLIRVPEKIKENLKVNNGKVFTIKGCKILFPRRYQEAGLAEVGSHNKVFGYFIWVVDDMYYGVNSVCAYVRLTPDEFNLIKINDEDYYEFVFDAGSTVIPDVNLLVDNSTIGEVYSEFIGKGNYPWGFDYNDACKIYDSAPKYAGVSVGKRPEQISVIISVTSRDKTDKTKYYRQVVASSEGDVANPPSFISLDAVDYAATNTMSRIGGNYTDVGIISSLIDPTEKVERIERILRY